MGGICYLLYKITMVWLISFYFLSYLHFRLFSGDETVSNVFRDFSNMASRQSEKLKRPNRQTIV